MMVSVPVAAACGPPETGLSTHLSPARAAMSRLARGSMVDRSMSSFPALAPASASPPGPNTQSRRSEEHTSELQSLMRISYAVFCLQKKKKTVYKYIRRRYAQPKNLHITTLK